MILPLLVVTVDFLLMRTAAQVPRAIGTLFCCPEAGPNGLFRQLQQATLFETFCDYGYGPNTITCTYDNAGPTDPTCPPLVPANPTAQSCPYTVYLNWDFDQTKCMDVRGANYADGTPVQVFDCNGTGAQRWSINRGGTKVRVAGTNFCLDAGSNPAIGVGMKIWECFDSLPAQAWTYNNNNGIALGNFGLCVSLPNGNPINGNQLQTQHCRFNNSDLRWTIGM